MSIITLKSSRDLARLRRLALASQGLLQARPFGTGLSGTRNAINHIGYVQIDTISVVERAHHHVLHSRVPGFRPAMVNELLRKRDIFEYWSHAAAFLPIDDFRFTLPYKHAIKNGQTHWYRNRDKKLMNELLARIRTEGPLRSRDVESETQKKAAGWWDWKPAKRALEQLYMQGDLMVSEREGFQKIYDLTERVLPPHVSTQMPSTEEFAEHLLERQLRSHGLASLKGLTYLRREPGVRKAVKTLVSKELAQGSLEQVKLENGETFILEAGTLEHPIPRLNGRMLILSPFDNCVIQRDRLKSLFSFDYQIECYVPAAKRRYGYFCLPLLYGDVFIGRMDCKADRKNRHLDIRSLHFEDHGFREEPVTVAFAEALARFCDFQQCDSASLHQVFPPKLKPALRRALDTMNPEINS